MPPSRTWRATCLTLCQNVKEGKGARSPPSQRSADLLALQVKQKPSRCMSPSKGAVWASVLIWPPFGKWRIYFFRQAAIDAAVALVWAGGVLEEFWVWLDQWQAYLLEPGRWFMHSGKQAFSHQLGRSRRPKIRVIAPTLRGQKGRNHLLLKKKININGCRGSYIILICKNIKFHTILCFKWCKTKTIQALKMPSLSEGMQTERTEVAEHASHTPPCLSEGCLFQPV